MNIHKKTEPSLELKNSDWELDFYSRPIIESNGKKRWELIICLSIINSPAEFSRSAVLRPIRPFSRSISDIKAFIISPSLKTSRKERMDPFVSDD